MRSVPSVGWETQPIIRMVEDLPAPLGPRKPNASPAGTSTSMPATAVKSPKRLTRPRAWISDPGWPESEGGPPAASPVRPEGSVSEDTGATLVRRYDSGAPVYLLTSAIAASTSPLVTSRTTGSSMSAPPSSRTVQCSPSIPGRRRATTRAAPWPGSAC